MPQQPSTLENDLLKLSASALDETLIARLEACANGTWTRQPDEELAFEQRLRAITPSPLSPALLASLESLTAATPFPSTSPIVAFPNAHAKPRPQPRKGWAAAAAVALIGGISALMIPIHQRTSSDTANTNPPSANHATINHDALVPAGFNRDLREAHDQGVVWQPDQNAHRVVKVVYMERVTLKSQDGKSYQVEQPRVEYILVPEQSD